MFGTLFFNSITNSVSNITYYLTYLQSLSLDSSSCQIFGMTKYQTLVFMICITNKQRRIIVLYFIKISFVLQKMMQKTKPKLNEYLSTTKHFWMVIPSSQEEMYGAQNQSFAIVWYVFVIQNIWWWWWLPSFFIFRTKKLYVLPMGPSSGFYKGIVIGFEKENDDETNQRYPCFNWQVI
jgi:hypothetical protein